MTIDTFWEYRNTKIWSIKDVLEKKFANNNIPHF